MKIIGFICGPIPNVKDLPPIENRLESSYFMGDATKRPNYILAQLALPTLGASNIKDEHILIANEPRIFN